MSGRPRSTITRSIGRSVAERIASRAGSGFMHDEAVELEAGAQEPADLDLVVDDENDRGGLTHRHRFPVAATAACVTGNSIETVVPSAGAGADGADFSAIRGDEGIGDPQAEARTAGGCGMTLAAREAVPDFRFSRRGQAGALVGDADDACGRRRARGGPRSASRAANISPHCRRSVPAPAAPAPDRHGRAASRAAGRPRGGDRRGDDGSARSPN